MPIIFFSLIKQEENFVFDDFTDDNTTISKVNRIFQV